MAIEIACRTRASRSGFFSSGLPDLSYTNGDRSRAWSGWKNSVRQDARCSTMNFGLTRSFAMSAVGTASIASTSPDSSAAIRVGSLVMMRSVTRSNAGFRLQCRSLRSSSIESPRRQLEKRHGPVPTTALPVLKSSVLAASATLRDTMNTFDRSSGSGP